MYEFPFSGELSFQSPKVEAVALRGLDIMKRNQLLEQTVNEREAEVLAKFFESEESKPDRTVEYYP